MSVPTPASKGTDRPYAHLGPAGERYMLEEPARASERARRFKIQAYVVVILFSAFVAGWILWWVGVLK